MSVGAARDAIFGDALATEDVRPAALVTAPVDAHLQRLHAMRGEALLRALSVLEDSRSDEPDDRNPTDPAVRRLEAKVDLLVGLVSSLMLRDAVVDAPRRLTWSARGACVAVEEHVALPDVGTPVVLRVQPSDALPESLHLPARVLAAEDANRNVWLRFDPLPPGLEALLERHLFRVHRRAVAESRRLK